MIQTSALSKEWNVVGQHASVGLAEAETPATAAKIEEEQVVHASIKAGSVAQIVVAVIAVLGLIYLGKARLDAKLSHLVTGWKSILLKPADPFFSKNGAGTERQEN